MVQERQMSEWEKIVRAKLCEIKEGTTSYEGALTILPHDGTMYELHLLIFLAFDARRSVSPIESGDNPAWYILERLIMEAVGRMRESLYRDQKSLEFAEYVESMIQWEEYDAMDDYDLAGYLDEKFKN